MRRRGGWGEGMAGAGLDAAAAALAGEGAGLRWLKLRGSDDFGEEHAGAHVGDDELVV